MKNLGTIARSDTMPCIEVLVAKGNTPMIRQFGVGFYAVHFIAGSKADGSQPLLKGYCRSAL